jgi:glycoside/pentoside/hexuronide:cation symporter, GPH family
MIASMSLAGVCAVPLLLTESLAATGAVLGFVGGAVGGLILGPDLLFAEVVDEDYAATGIRREGTYRGILGFVFRFPPAVTGLLLGEGLALAGYNADLTAAEQPAAVGTLIRLYASLLPLLTLAIGVGLLWFYPLYGERLRAIQARVRERSAALPRTRGADDTPPSDLKRRLEGE